jgi:hypothetical protein
MQFFGKHTKKSLKLQPHASDATGYGEVQSCVGTMYCSPQRRFFQLITFRITFMIPLCPSSHFNQLSCPFQKSSVFWYITPRSPLNVNRRFGGTCCLHSELLGFWTLSIVRYPKN